MPDKKNCDIPADTPLADGGIPTALYTDCTAAYGSTDPADRRRAFMLLIAAGVTFAVLLLSRLIGLLEPALDRIRHGTVTEIIYYGILAVIFIGYAVGLDLFLKKHCGFKLFAIKDQTISIPRALGVVAVGAVAVFVVSASLGFKFKMELEIGYGVTANTALLNVSSYIYYAEHMLMGFIIAALVQTAASTLMPARYTVPWGAIALVTVYGLVEFVLELYATAHPYCWVYYFFSYAYAAIYVLTKRSFHISFWASVVLMVL